VDQLKAERTLVVFHSPCGDLFGLDPKHELADVLQLWPRMVRCG
jgi:hypothetical protein